MIINAKLNNQTIKIKKKEKKHKSKERKTNRKFFRSFWISTAFYLLFLNCTKINK